MKLLPLYSLFLLINLLNASDIETESYIYDKLIHGIVHTSKPHVYIYGKVNSLQKYHDHIILEEHCKDADIVILSTLKRLPSACNSKLLFGTKYLHTKDSRVLGAFFWQKGRPNIIFYQNRLKQHHVTLDSDFTKFIEK